MDVVRRVEAARAARRRGRRWVVPCAVAVILLSSVGVWLAPRPRVKPSAPAASHAPTGRLFAEAPIEVTLGDGPLVLALRLDARRPSGRWIEGARAYTARSMTLE